LTSRIEAWRERAHVWSEAGELFTRDSWMHVMLGQGLVPRQHHPLPRALPDADLRRLLEGVRRPIDQAVARMPPQQSFIDRYCKAPPEVWGMKRATA
jgi:tryptophan halogenase